MAPNTLATPSGKTITTPHHLHPLVEVDFPPFVDDFHLEMDLALDKEAFIFALTHSPHLSSNNPSGMVYELLRDCFVPNHFVNGFDLFIEICEHIIRGHVFPLVSCLLVTS